MADATARPTPMLPTDEERASLDAMRATASASIYPMIGAAERGVVMSALEDRFAHALLAVNLVVEKMISLARFCGADDDGVRLLGAMLAETCRQSALIATSSHVEGAIRSPAISRQAQVTDAPAGTA
jgi:hypothetical protein